jgi:uncharacterized low-complexity protein
MGFSNWQAHAFRETSFKSSKTSGEYIMNNMPSKKSVISLALGSAFAVTLGTASVASASDNPFAAQSLEKGGYEPSKDGYGEKRDGYGEKRGDKKYGEGRCGMSMADTDNDGKVSRDEHARHADTMFEKMDTNKDGYIDKDEASAMKKKHRHDRGHGDSYRSGDKYGDRDGRYGDRDGGVDIHRYREEGAGQKYDRDLPHMKPMGQ